MKRFVCGYRWSDTEMVLPAQRLSEWIAERVRDGLRVQCAVVEARTARTDVLDGAANGPDEILRLASSSRSVLVCRSGAGFGWDDYVATYFSAEGVLEEKEVVLADIFDVRKATHDGLWGILDSLGPVYVFGHDFDWCILVAG